MTLLRGQILTIGPLALMAICYAIAAPFSPSDGRPRETMPPGDQASSIPRHLTIPCQSVASDLQRRLPEGWSVLVREPFVLGGDFDAKRLDQHYRQTIIPTARAMSVQYFDHSPTWPVTILLCSSDESYRECNRQLGERERNEYSGIYSRTLHRVVVNVATGDGTLAHELTHALAHADFCDLPEWLDEGLASLHEECEFSSDGLRLIGLDNWRRPVLREAYQRDLVRSVSDLAGEPFAASDRATIDYAHARCFCLFLQQRRLLEPFYRKCRSRAAADPTGIAALCELFAVRDSSKIDAEFLEWLGQREAATR